MKNSPFQQTKRSASDKRAVSSLSTTEERDEEDRLKVTVAYKARSAADSESNFGVGSSLITPALMKSLNIRSGSLFCLQCGESKVLLKAWLSKQVQSSATTIFVSKYIQPTIELEENKSIFVNKAALVR